MAYTRLDDPDNSQRIDGELLRRAAEHDAKDIVATEPGEWRLIQILSQMPLPLRQLPDDRFLATHAEFEDWARDRKELRMEWFYRLMRRKTGLLMEGDEPAGGKWNYDHDNRKARRARPVPPAPPRFPPDDITQQVLDLVRDRFGDNFGDLLPFDYATDRAGALRVLGHFIEHSLDLFGPYQDAMLVDDPFLHHSILSPYLNCGLLSPSEVCQAAADAWQAGKVRLNSAEGFIRQIWAGANSCAGSISWRGRITPAATRWTTAATCPASIGGPKRA